MNKIKSLRKTYKQLPLQAKASIWFLAASFMQRGISVITTPVFTRLMTTAEYGKYNVFNSWLNILSIFVTLSLYQGTYLQGMVKFDNRRKVYSSTLQGLLIVLILIWTGAYLLFRDKLNHLFDLNTIQMVCLLLLCWLTAVWGFWSTEQRVEYKYVRVVIVTVIVMVAKPVLEIVAVVVSKDKVTARIVSFAFVEFTVYIWLFFAQMKRGKKFFDKEIWYYALGYAIPLIPHYLSGTVLSSADRIMIKSMISESAAGIYGLGYSISQIMMIFNTSLMQAINPWLYQKIKDGKLKDMAKIAYPAMALIAGLNILMISFAPEIVKIFAPREYCNTIYIIPPVAMSVFFMFAYDFFACFEFYFEYTKYIASATMIAAVTNIILNFIFIRAFGYYAAGYTTLLCYSLYALGHYYMMRKVCRQHLGGEVPYDPKVLLKIVSIFLALGFVFMCTYDFASIRYGLIVVLTIVAIKKAPMTYVRRVLKMKER